RRAGGRADRRGGVGIEELAGIRRQCIEPRGLVERGAVAAQIRPPQVVDVDEHDVRCGGHFTAPAVMPLRKYRCENRKIASTGMLIISTAAISRFHCVEFSW